MWGLGLATLAWAAAAGCDRAPDSAVAPIPLTQPSHPVRAQPKLKTTKLWVGAEVLEAELAVTWQQQQTGMMFRTNMAENEAMLFVFPYVHRAAFWMMNTPLPLSAAYIDPEGVILEIHDLQPFNTNSVVAGTDQVQYVLETRQGWFNRHGIEPGAVLRTETGSLKDAFFPNGPR